MAEPSAADELLAAVVSAIRQAVRRGMPFHQVCVLVRGEAEYRLEKRYGENWMAVVLALESTGLDEETGGIGPRPPPDQAR